MGNSSSQYPPFTLDKPLYRQDSYWGRVRHFMNVTDIRMCFVSKERITDSLKLMDQYREGKLPSNVTNSDLWKARKVVEATTLPITKERIFAPFRFSAFALMNIPISAGLLIPSPAIPVAVFWQWINQSYNVAVNYSNRNPSNPLSFKQIGQAYGAAVISSCGLAVGLGEIVKRAKNLHPVVGLGVRICVPFVAVASAGIVNVFLIRKNEIIDGVTMRDENGNEYGKSKIAGLRGLTECGLTRIVWNIPLLIFPPIIMNQLVKIKKIGSSPRNQFLSQLVLIIFGLLVGVPLSIGLFPQIRSIETKQLEPEFHNLPVKQLYWNKGL